MSVATIKARMVEILDGGNGWCKGSNAVTADGTPISIFHKNAKKWDVFGALALANKEQGSINYEDFHKVYIDLKNNIPSTYKNMDIESYNDDVDFPEILALING